MQYTIRHVPPHLDVALRQRARERGVSLNEIALETLIEGVGLGETIRRRRLADIVGSWVADSDVDEALADQRRIDPEDLVIRVALDTNRYRDLCDGDMNLAALLETADSVHLPFVVIAELRAGFAVGKKGRENERVLQRFLAKPGVAPLFPRDSTLQAYANLYRQLRQQGTPIPTNDLWIAALVVDHNLTLCSRDRHFRHLPQLDIV